MYFWRIDRLKDQLRAGNVPARDVFGYVTAHLVIQLSQNFMPVPTADADPIGTPILVLLSVLTLFGFWVLYRVNGGADGHDFAGRLLAIPFVVGVRVIVPLMILFQVLAISVVMAVGAGDSGLNVIVALGIAMALFYYWRVFHHFREVAVQVGTTNQ